MPGGDAEAGEVLCFAALPAGDAEYPLGEGWGGGGRAVGCSLAARLAVSLFRYVSS